MRLLLLALGLVLSMSMGSRRPAPSTPPIEQNAPIPSPKVEIPINEAPAGTVLVSAKISGKAGDGARIEKLHKLTPIVQRILNSPEFEARMLKAWYDGKPGFQDSNETPAQVISKLKSSPWNQVYEFGTNSKKVLGWTYPSTSTVWFNVRNFDGRDDCGLVGTRFHEETHKRGYGHKNARRTLSVPYMAGTQAAIICKEFKTKGAL